jgi:hypothetical protein
MAGGRQDRRKPRAKLAKIAHFLEAWAEAIEASAALRVSSVSFARLVVLLRRGFLFPLETCIRDNVNRHQFEGGERRAASLPLLLVAYANSRVARPKGPLCFRIRSMTSQSLLAG